MKQYGGWKRLRSKIYYYSKYIATFNRFNNYYSVDISIVLAIYIYKK